MTNLRNPREFSVVMSIYAGDSVGHFRQALDSVRRQTLAPAELIIVVDGAIGPELEGALHEASSGESAVRVFRLPHNVGLGGARHRGICEAQHGIIAVMDADDICVPDRFELQAEALSSEESCDIVGGWIEEFDYRPGDLGRIRTVPLTHEEIFKRGKWRNPMNHVTVMFRKQAYLDAGGYQFVKYYEDLDLFSRMLINGAKFKNIPEVLVLVRCGPNMFIRRGGWRHIVPEIGVFWRMVQIGYINPIEFALGLLIRIPIRLLPWPLRQWIYSRGLRKYVSLRSGHV